MDENCEDTGSLFAWVGTAKGDKNGGGHLRTLVDDICLHDFLGNAVEIRGKYSAYGNRYGDILACGAV